MHIGTLRRPLRAARRGVKIAYRSEVNDWARGDPATDGYFEARPDALRGARKPEEAIYHRKRMHRSQERG